jgi:riboflavin kinase/FMN adenylyltransferase
VYACFAGVGEKRHPAAVNVGVRPTFGGGDVLIEAYLLDFEGDLYDQEIRVEFVEYLRAELAFDSVDALIEQMAEDVSATRSILDAAGDRM